MRLGFYKSKSKKTNILQIIVEELNFRIRDNTKTICMIRPKLIRCATRGQIIRSQFLPLKEIICFNSPKQQRIVINH